MNVGELFISLGVKGSQETVSALSEIEAKLKAIGGVIPKIKMPKPDSNEWPMPKSIGDHIRDQQKSIWAQRSKIHPEMEGVSKRSFGLGSRYKEFSNNFQNKLKVAKKNLNDFFDTKPSEKAPKAVEEVGTGLKRIGSMSLEAKAAIVGVIYALDRLFSNSGAKGAELLNASALLNQNTETLQRYQYVAKLAGMSNEELTNSFLSLSDQMSKYRTTGVPPQFWGRFQEKMGPQSAENVRDYIEHPEKLLQMLQTYSQIEKDVGVRNQVLESFVGKNMSALLIRKKVTPEALAAAPIYSEEGVKKLDKSREAWTKLAESINMMFGRLNIRFGESLAKNINKLLPDIERLVNSFLKLADQVHAFKLLDTMFKGWSELFKTMSTVIDYFTDLYNGKISPAQAKDDLNINASAGGMLLEHGIKSAEDFALTLYNRAFGSEKGLKDFKKNRDEVFENVKGWVKENFFPDKPIMRKKKTAPGEPEQFEWLTPGQDVIKNPKNSIAPTVRSIGKTSQNGNVFHINQNLAFHGKQEHVRELASEFKKSVTDALLNIPLVINS